VRLPLEQHVMKSAHQLVYRLASDDVVEILAIIGGQLSSDASPWCSETHVLTRSNSPARVWRVPWAGFLQINKVSVNARLMCLKTLKGLWQHPRCGKLACADHRSRRYAMAFFRFKVVDFPKRGGKFPVHCG
jgi:hypothetical protein